MKRLQMNVESKDKDLTNKSNITSISVTGDGHKVWKKAKLYANKKGISLSKLIIQLLADEMDK